MNRSATVTCEFVTSAGLALRVALLLMRLRVSEIGQ